MNKNTRSISSQRICEFNGHMHDPLRCYKSYVFFQRETEQLLIPTKDDMYPNATQQLAPYSLDYRTVSNYDSQFGRDSLLRS